MQKRPGELVVEQQPTAQRPRLVDSLQTQDTSSPFAAIVNDPQLLVQTVLDPNSKNVSELLCYAISKFETFPFIRFYVPNLTGLELISSRSPTIQKLCFGLLSSVFVFLHCLHLLNRSGRLNERKSSATSHLMVALTVVAKKNPSLFTDRR